MRRFMVGLVAAWMFAGAPAAGAGNFDAMISPVSVPTINEDPRMTTELRPMFMYTDISDDFVTGGGDYEVVAAQARLALGDRFGLIATKDGYVFLRPEAVVPDDDGFANLAFGAKAALIYDEPAARIVTFGLRYEAPTGNRDVLQGKGDGLVNPFVSAAQGFGDLHVQGYTGPRLAIDDDDSSFYDLSLHVDYAIDRFYPLVELDWIYVLEGGKRLPIDQEGFDLVNIGSSEAGGESVATLAFGARYRLHEQVDIGAAYELPVTDREDIVGWRVTTDLVLRLW